MGVADQFEDRLTETPRETAREVEGDGEAAEGNEEDGAFRGAGGREFLVERVVEIKGGVVRVARG